MSNPYSILLWCPNATREIFTRTMSVQNARREGVEFDGTPEECSYNIIRDLSDPCTGVLFLTGVVDFPVSFLYLGRRNERVMMVCTYYSFGMESCVVVKCSFNNHFNFKRLCYEVTCLKCTKKNHFVLIITPHARSIGIDWTAWSVTTRVSFFQTDSLPPQTVYSTSVCYLKY